MRCINRSVVTQRWYLIWDDLWRRNKLTVAGLANAPAAFSPFYRSSLCYRPMPRQDLENYLQRYGLWSTSGHQGVFHHGFLNRIYFLLDEVVFGGTSNAIPITLGASCDQKRPVDFDKLTTYAFRHGPGTANSSAFTSATYNTGDGTSHDDPEIRARPAFPFEEVYEPAPVPWHLHHWREKLQQIGSDASVALQAWLGLLPYERRHRGLGVHLSLRPGKEYLQLSKAHKDSG